MRNPAVAAVLHELNWAETKGSGIRTMRRLSGEAGLPLPEFVSDRQKNEFKVTLFLHNLLTEDDFAWLKALTGDTLNADEAKVLIYARETGAVDNTACRDFCGLDTLQASAVLRRLRDRDLLEKQGAGSRTHYVLSISSERADPHPEQGKLMLEPIAEGNKHSLKGGKLSVEGVKLSHADLPPELTTLLPKVGERLSAQALRQLICILCSWRSLRGEELATLLGKDLKYLRNKHLTVMVQNGQLGLLYPEADLALTRRQDHRPDSPERPCGRRTGRHGHAGSGCCTNVCRLAANVIPVAVLRDLEAVRLGKRGQLLVAGVIDDFLVLIVPYVADTFKEEQWKDVGFEVCCIDWAAQDVGGLPEVRL